jgi:biopolymer transport protein ExbB/TolQ
MSETFDVLKEQFFSLEEHFDDLLAASATEDQRTALRNAFAQSRDNFNKAANKILDDNDPQVEELRDELKDKQSEIDHSLANLKTITQVIDTITAAVDVGTKIVSL